MSLMAKTQDFESCDLGSIPSRVKSGDKMFIDINREVVNMSMVKNFFFFEDSQKSEIIFQYERWDDVKITATINDFYEVMERLEKAGLAIV